VEDEDVDHGDRQEDQLQAEPQIVIIKQWLGVEKCDASHHHQHEAEDGQRQHPVANHRDRRLLESDAQKAEVDEEDRPGEQHQGQHVRAFQQAPDVERAG
jgi:hypothetical protein